MNESEYRQYWIAQLFHAEAQSQPVTLFSNGLQKEAIAAFPGAIALVDPVDVKTRNEIAESRGPFARRARSSGTLNA
jgi:hypothetical protein